MGPVAQVKVF